MDEHIRESLDISLITKSQHAYTKGKSVETALHSLVGHIEKSIEYDNFNLTSFLDIEGAPKLNLFYFPLDLEYSFF